MGRSPGLRPLTLQERMIAWLVAIAPVTLINAIILTIVYLLTLPDAPLWRYVIWDTPPTLVEIPLPFGASEGIEINLRAYLSRSFYLVSYLTWGRSLGHLGLDAHVLDRKTMRPMGTGRRLIRGATHILTAPFYSLMDFLSLLLILVDREERRSVYDWIAGTVVVMGDLPPETEQAPQRSWLSELSRALRRRPALEPQG